MITREEALEALERISNVRWYGNALYDSFSLEFDLIKQALTPPTNTELEEAFQQILTSLQELASFKNYTFIENHNDKLKIGCSDFKAYNNLKSHITQMQKDKEALKYQLEIAWEQIDTITQLKTLLDGVELDGNRENHRYAIIGDSDFEIHEYLYNIIKQAKELCK